MRSESCYGQNHALQALGRAVSEVFGPTLVFHLNEAGLFYLNSSKSLEKESEWMALSLTEKNDRRRSCYVKA